VKKDARIFVAGHTGMVGSAITRLLQKEGYSNLLLKRSGELDLRNQPAVQAFFAETKPLLCDYCIGRYQQLHSHTQW